MAGLVLAVACAWIQVGSAAGTAQIKGDDFPIAELAIIAGITAVVTAMVGALAWWKSKNIERSLEDSFERTGNVIGGHPVKAIACSLVLLAVLIAGNPLREKETDPAKSWIPTGSTILEHRKLVENSWTSEAYPTFVFTTPRVGDNMLTPDNIRALFRDHNNLMSIRVDGDAVVKRNLDLADYTSQLGGTWTFQSMNGTRTLGYDISPPLGVTQYNLLHIFRYKADVIANLTEETLQMYLKAWDDAPMFTFVSPINELKIFDLSTVLGGIHRTPSGSMGADLARTTYFPRLEQFEVSAYEGDQVNPKDPLVGLWESEAVCTLGIVKKSPAAQRLCEEPSQVKHVGFFYRTTGDEFTAAIADDMGLITGAYVIIFVYLLFLLGKWDFVWSRFSLSLVVTAVVGMSLASTYGLGGYLGIMESSLNMSIPFLLLGLGVDDAFVLAAEFTHHTMDNPYSTTRERMALTFKTGGISVLVTSLTDALAFLVGSSTRLPALSSFCMYAGFGVAFLFLYMLIFFLPFLALDSLRADHNRFDCLCCLKADTKHELWEPMGFCVCLPESVSRRSSKIQPDDLLSTVLERLGRFVVSPRGTGLTFAGFFALACVGVAGLTQLQKDFKMEWLFPEDSYVHDFNSLNEEYFQTGELFDVYLNNVDFQAEAGAMNELSSYLAAQDYIQEGSINDWWMDFTAQVPTYSSLGHSDFYEQLHDWHLKNVQHQTNIKWSSPSCVANCSMSVCRSSCTTAEKAQGISHAKIGATMVSFKKGKLRYDVYRTYTEDIRRIFDDQTGMRVFPYAQAFMFWVEMGIIDVELARSLVIAGGIIFTIIVAMIPHLRIALLVAANICFAIMEIVGLAHYWGISMNALTTVFIGVSVGLSVDYSVHVAHSFVAAPARAKERAVEALARTGPSVLNALISNVLAVMALASSTSFIFSTLFKILSLVSFVAGGHALVLLPVLLDTLGGQPSFGGALRTSSMRASVNVRVSMHRQRRESQRASIASEMGSGMDSDAGPDHEGARKDVDQPNSPEKCSEEARRADLLARRHAEAPKKLPNQIYDLADEQDFEIHDLAVSNTCAEDSER